MNVPECPDYYLIWLDVINVKFKYHMIHSKSQFIKYRVDDDEINHLIYQLCNVTRGEIVIHKISCSATSERNEYQDS
jgi:hypothetical protein